MSKVAHWKCDLLGTKCDCQECFVDRENWKRLTPQEQKKVCLEMWRDGQKMFGDWRTKMLAKACHKSLKEFEREVK